MDCRCRRLVRRATSAEGEGSHLLYDGRLISGQSVDSRQYISSDGRRSGDAAINGSISLLLRNRVNRADGFSIVDIIPIILKQMEHILVHISGRTRRRA
jgi:hypothetical protein